MVSQNHECRLDTKGVRHVGEGRGYGLRGGSPIVEWKKKYEQTPHPAKKKKSVSLRHFATLALLSAEAGETCGACMWPGDPVMGANGERVEKI